MSWLGEVWANFPPRANIRKAPVIEDVVAGHLNGFNLADPRDVQDALRASPSVFILHGGQVQVFEHVLKGTDTALRDLTLREAGVRFAISLD